MSLEVADVRQILLDIKAFDRTKKGMVETDFARAETLLETFTEERVCQQQALSDAEITTLASSLSARWEDDLVRHANDYTINQEGHNKYWIELATQLAGLRRIERTSKTLSKSKFPEERYKNALELLIPTLIEKHLEPVSLEPWDNVGIKNLLLSDDGTQLLSVVGAYENAKVNHVLRCFTYEGMSRRFTEKEKLRLEAYKKKIVKEYSEGEDIAHDHPTKTFYELLDYKRQAEAQPRITKETVLALKKLAEGSASRRGIGYEVNDPDSPEYQSAAKAYAEFREYLDKITPEEKAALWSQIVESSQVTERTFGEEYDFTVTVNPNREQLCTTLVALAWAKLVMQYMPNAIFDNQVLEEKKIEQGWAFDTVPLTASDRVPFKGFDKDKKDETYYKKSCLSLLVHIMSNQFNVAPIIGGETITFKGQTNQSVPSSASKMLAILEHALYKANDDHDDSLQRYKRAYFNVLHHVVEPALKNPSPTRYSDTQSWLESLLKETFWTTYQKEGVIDFEQSHLGEKLLFFVNNYTTDKVKEIDKIQDRIMHLSLKDAPYTEASIELLIIAKQLKSRVSEDDAKVLDMFLSGKKSPFTKQHPPELYLKESIIRQYLYYLSFRESRGPANLFKAIRESSEKLFGRLTGVFDEIKKIVHPSTSIQKIISLLADKLQEEHIVLAQIGRDKADRFLGGFETTFINTKDPALFFEAVEEVNARLSPP